MSTLVVAPSNVTAPTQFLQVQTETYGYDASVAGPRILTSRGRWTIGIRLSPTLSRADEKSSCSTTRASDAQPRRSPS